MTCLYACVCVHVCGSYIKLQTRPPTNLPQTNPPITNQPTNPSTNPSTNLKIKNQVAELPSLESDGVVQMAIMALQSVLSTDFRGTEVRVFYMLTDGCLCIRMCGDRSAGGWAGGSDPITPIDQPNPSTEPQHPNHQRRPRQVEVGVVQGPEGHFRTLSLEEIDAHLTAITERDA